MRFKGKVGGWFYATMIFVAVVTVPTLIRGAMFDYDLFALIINWAVFVLVEGFFVSILLFNYVELKEGTLFIRFGPIKTQIPYSDIVSLSKTNNPLSSLAASLDRIEIRRKAKSGLMISIKDKERFFEEIKKINPDIKIF